MPIQKGIIKSQSDLYDNVIYLLGSSTLGAKNMPTLIENKRDLEIFGEGELVDAYSIIKEVSSNTNVFLCKVTGSHAIATLDVSVAGESYVRKDAVTISSIYANEVYNDIQISITPTFIKFSFPETLRTKPIAYEFEKYKTVYSLAMAISKDTSEKRNHVYISCTSNITTSTLHTTNDTTMKMHGGNSGTSYTKNQLFYSLEETYALLHGHRIDIITPVGAYVDDISTSLYGESGKILKLNDEIDKYFSYSYYAQLLDFCSKQKNAGVITHGIMGYGTTTDRYLRGDIEAYINYTSYFLKENISMSKQKEESYLISCCVGDIYTSHMSDVGNHYIAYSSLVASSGINTNVTNQSYPPSIVIRNEFNNEHFVKLATDGLVVLRVSPKTDRVTIVSAVTTAASESDMHLLCNARQIQSTISRLHDTLDSYIGENLTDIYDALVLDVEGILNSLREHKVIDKYIVDINEDKDNGKLICTILLKTLFMVEYISINNELKYLK